MEMENTKSQGNNIAVPQQMCPMYKPGKMIGSLLVVFEPKISMQ